jgi:hypothetical protein
LIEDMWTPWFNASQSGMDTHLRRSRHRRAAFRAGQLSSV